MSEPLTRRCPEEILDSLAVRILCGDGGCQPEKPCPFDPMCAADLTPESQYDAIVAANATLRRANERMEATLRLAAEEVSGYSDYDTDELMAQYLAEHDRRATLDTDTGEGL